MLAQEKSYTETSPMLDTTVFAWNKQTLPQSYSKMYYLEAFGNPYPMLRARPFHQDFFIWCFSTPLGINLVPAPADRVDVYLGFGAGADASGRGAVACANYYFDSYSTKLALRGATVSVTINSTTTGVAVTDDMFNDFGGPSAGGIFIGNYPATPPPSFNVNSVTMPT